MKPVTYGIPKWAETKMWAFAHWCVSPIAGNYTTVPVTNIRPDGVKDKLVQDIFR
jgi:hypothetical protein